MQTPCIKLNIMLLYQSAFLWALYITFHLLKDGFFMDYIKYKTTLKASGDEYKKIVSQYVPGSYICGMLGIPDLYIFLPVQKQC